VPLIASIVTLRLVLVYRSCSLVPYRRFPWFPFIPLSGLKTGRRSLRLFPITTRPPRVIHTTAPPSLFPAVCVFPCTNTRLFFRYCLSIHFRAHLSTFVTCQDSGTSGTGYSHSPGCSTICSLLQGQLRWTQTIVSFHTHMHAIHAIHTAV
jgi:hypothetical protein